MSGGGRVPTQTEAPPPPPIPAPPVSSTGPAVTAVQNALRLQQLRRRNMSTTFYAAGGGMNTAPAPGPITGAGPSMAASNGTTKTG